VQLGRFASNAHVARDRAILLRESREVEHRRGEPLEMRRHADDRADGQHAGAADAGDQDSVGPR
jgi:hypothetical protein